MINRLELDVMQASELIEAAHLAVKHKLPAMIVHPMIASEALMARGKTGGIYKIITPVDWPKGDTYGMTKFRGLSTDALDADGFEILLTHGKNPIDTKKEAKLLTEFIKMHLSELAEVRFVIGAYTRTTAEIETILDALLTVRMPTLIRIDCQLKLQVSKANAEIHNSIIDLIRKHISAPVKLSGNITSVRSVTACNRAERFAVNLLQAKAIIKEFNSQPNELRHMLAPV